MLNIAATSGKNLQNTFSDEKTKGAYEIKPVATPSPNNRPSALFSSLSHPPISSYGGRQLRYRDYENLKPWQVYNLHTADSVARAMGMPLNTFISIFWEATFPGAAAMAKTFARGMKRLNAWLSYHKTRFVYIYVHENPDDAKPNSHLLVHVPKKLKAAFIAKALGFFDALDGGVRRRSKHLPSLWWQSKSWRPRHYRL